MILIRSRIESRFLTRFDPAAIYKVWFGLFNLQAAVHFVSFRRCWQWL